MWEPFESKDSISRIVEAVRSAPSVFGSQPWSLRIAAGDRIELRANSGERDHVYRGKWAKWAQRTAGPDPLTREFAISCGAALYDLRLAVRVAGHEVSEWLLPDPDSDPGLLASVEIVTSRVKPPLFAEQEMYEAMWLRHTSRWPFSAPVPMPLVVAMETAAARQHCWLRLMHRAEVRAWLRAVAGADAELSAAGGLNTERACSFRKERDLLLSVARPVGGPAPDNAAVPVTRRDFWLPERKARFERRPQLMSLATDDDRPLDWLRAGQALQRAILTATRYSMSARYCMADGDSGRLHYGVAVSFLTQPLEVQDIRSVPRRFPSRTSSRYGDVPQMVLRAGYAPVMPVPPHPIRPDVIDARQPPVTKAEDW
jgi:nitroreductase